MVGPYREWYYEMKNGKKKATFLRKFECYNIESKLHGCKIRWWRSGKKEIHHNYKDGKPDGRWTRWNEKPWRKTHINEYEDGKLKSLERYHSSNGKPITKETYENGKLVKWVVYDADGKPIKITEGTFKEKTHQIITGTVTKRTPSGTKVVETYSNGKLVSRSEQ
jgi:antitoxin component YwqK of YwqJK toxin-antitoxin module